MPKTHLFFLFLTLLPACKDSEKTTPTSQPPKKDRTTTHHPVPPNLKDALLTQNPAQLQQSLTNHPDATLHHLASLTGEIPHDLILSTLQNHYQDATLDQISHALFLLEPNPGLAAPLAQSLLENHADRNPQAALDWLASPDSGSLGAYAAQAIGKKVGEQPNPATALEKINQLEVTDTVKGQLLTGLFTTLSRNDHTAALELLNTLPPSPLLDQVYHTYTFESSRIDPGNTMLWAEQISAPGLRQNSIHQVAEQWYLTHAESYREWLKNADLDPDLRGALPK